MGNYAARVEGPGEGISGLEETLVDGGWKLRHDGSDSGIHDAIVPGDVHSSLMRSGVVPDPLLGRNNEKTKWISNKAWIYTNFIDIERVRDHVLAAFGEGGIAHLVFDAIDYDASFYLDNRFICRQTGMFSPVDIGIGITPRDAGICGQIPVSLRFHVQPWWRQHALKCQMAFGWDFAPEIRTIGIWKHVRLHHTGPAMITRARVEPVPVVNSPGAACIRASIKVTIVASFHDPASLSPLRGRHDVEVGFAGIGIDKVFPVKMEHGIPVEIMAGEADLNLWEPWSLGQPHVARARIRLIWKGVVSDEYRASIANRFVAWARNPGTLRGDEDWTLAINGKRIFIRGINWVPPDSIFGRLDGARYEQLVDKAIEMNVDMLRVWGGGIEEKTEFYDYCDRVGMLVWQEFPFACTNYPRDPRYLRIARAECGGIAQRTSRHPSVVVYCAGNEFNPIINAHVVSICKEAVALHAPGIHCFAASPVRGDDHNWKVWGARRRLDSYELDGEGSFQMLTEFGMQALPCMDTLRACCDAEVPPSIEAVASDLAYHKADMAGLLHYARAYSAPANSVEALLKASQCLQAHAVKRAVEVCRSGWPNVSGVFPWQLSDPWPNVSWSVIDHNLQPKLAARVLKLSYAPVLPMMRNWRHVPGKRGWRRGDLVVHNATQEAFHGSVAVQVVYKNGISRDVVLETGKIPVTVTPGRPLRVKSLEGEAMPGTVVSMRLFNEAGEPTTTNVSFPAMEVPRTATEQVRDKIDARFDGWWRKHLTRVMEADRLRTDFKEWRAKRALLNDKS